jgi:hypothetical protein
LKIDSIQKKFKHNYFDEKRLDDVKPYIEKYMEEVFERRKTTGKCKN